MNYIDHIKGYLSRAALLLLMAGGALMAGCEDFLVRDVPNQTTDEEWWQNKGQLNTALNNLYKPMPSGTITYVNHDVKQSQASGYPNARVEMEALTDNGVGSANYVSYNAFTAGITSSSEDVCNKIWNMKWTVIRRCCRFMEHYQQATVAPDAAPHEGIQTVDRFAAEARALRAFYHLELFLFFGDIPLVDHSTLPTEQFLVRRPQQEVVDWIAGELEGASHNLPVVPQTKSERWRWTKGACYAWMSYLYLYVGDWANAKKWAEEVVKLGIYDLYRSTADPADSFRRQFIHEAYNNDTKESILTTELGMRQVQRRLAPPTAVTARPVCRPRRRSSTSSSCSTAARSTNCPPTRNGPTSSTRSPKSAIRVWACRSSSPPRPSSAIRPIRGSLRTRTPSARRVRRRPVTGSRSGRTKPTAPITAVRTAANSTSRTCAMRWCCSTTSKLPSS